MWTFLLPQQHCVKCGQRGNGRCLWGPITGLRGHTWVQRWWGGLQTPVLQDTSTISLWPLPAGGRLISLNHISLEGVTFTEAAEVMQSSPEEVQLIISQPKGAPCVCVSMCLKLCCSFDPCSPLFACNVGNLLISRFYWCTCSGLLTCKNEISFHFFVLLSAFFCAFEHVTLSVLLWMLKFSVFLYNHPTCLSLCKCQFCWLILLHPLPLYDTI